MNIQNMIDRIGDVRLNPSAMQRVVIDALEEVRSGNYGVVDPSNPFIFLLESAIASASAGISRNEVLLRRQYPSLARNYRDLYHHMSDVDYADRFAQPSRAKFTFMMSLDEIKRRSLDVEGRYRKLTIPKETSISIDGMTFTLNYPIELRVMPHGGIRIVYDTSQTSPLETLISNTIEFTLVRLNLQEATDESTMVKFDVPLYQFSIKPHYDQLTKASGYNKNYSFNDQFYYCRVYISDSDSSEWTEIKATHSDQVYDPNEITASLRVLDNQLNVTIPQIYFTQGLLGRGIRVDIYTTKGVVNQSLESYNPESFNVRWEDLRRIPDPYTVPITEFGTMLIFSTDRILGGRDALPFEELRRRVINNALGQVSVPITPVQLESSVSNLGYTIVKDVDNITNRMYLATRTLPTPSSVGSNASMLSTTVGCTVKALQVPFNQLNGRRGIYVNDDRVTLSSNMVFRLDDGKLNLIDNTEADALDNTAPEIKAQLLRERNYVYIPFHYVLDATRDAYAARAYHLDRPAIESKEFISENETAQLNVSSFRYGIDKTDAGYRIVIITRSGAIFRNLEGDKIHLQLSFVPPGENTRAYMNATYLGRDAQDNEHMFEFNIQTSFDINAQNNLILNSFFMFDTEARRVECPLQQGFELTYFVEDYTVDGIETSDLDNTRGHFLLPNDVYGVIRERLNVSFGEALTGLWTRARSVIGEQIYKRYEHDVPAVYESNVYERNEDGSLKVSVVNGKIETHLIHAAGDPILDEQNNPIYRHNAGDVQLDSNGEPVLISDRNIVRETDLMLFEGVFKYVTDTNVINYTNQVIQTLVKWVTSDISSLNKRLLENTDIWFYPKVSMGAVTANVDSGSIVTIDADQSFRVRMYMSASGHENLPLRASLTQSVLRVISSMIGRKTVSTVAMSQAIKDQVGEDVIDVVITGLGGFNNNYDIITVVEDSDSLGIRKRISVLPNNTLTVEDDINVEFIRHRD